MKTRLYIPPVRPELPLPLRLMMKAMKKPEGDARDWEAIRDWAQGVRPAL